MPETTPTTNVQGVCPACKRSGLFLGAGGYVTCPHLDCPRPDAATDVLVDGPRRAVDVLTEFRATASADLDRLEQRLAEAGYIPTTPCPSCHGTGKTSPHLAQENGR